MMTLRSGTELMPSPQQERQRVREAALGWRTDREELWPFVSAADSLSLTDELVLGVMLQHLTLKEAVRLSSVSKRFCHRVRAYLQCEPAAAFAARLPPKPRPIRDVRVSTAGSHFARPCIAVRRSSSGDPYSAEGDSLGHKLPWTVRLLLERLLRPSDHEAVWSQRPQEPGGLIIHSGGPLSMYRGRHTLPACCP